MTSPGDPHPNPVRNGQLGRLRLGAEPIAEQMERLRRVTWMITGVAAGLGLFFLALFSAFGEPGIGLAVATVLLGPVVGLAWIDLARHRRYAAEYERERASRSRSSLSSP